jgi:hypothetical protein
MEGAYNAAILDDTTTVFSKTLSPHIWIFDMVAQCSCFYSKIGNGHGGYCFDGRRVSSDKIEQVGFQFKFKTWRLH